jgi:C-terminal processing protease CtpA/Prc
VYLQTKPGDTFTPLARFHSVEETNDYGQAYIKPVGVFHNANCYSACEFFGSALQDNLATALVFGEDPQSGGG